MITDTIVATKYLNIKANAEKRNKEFHMTLPKVRALLKRERCFYTGTRFEEHGDKKRTFDRIDSELGYTNDNVVVCTRRVNLAKANLTIKEIQMMAKKLRH